jgi:cytochrome o ubiquinol oxidase subunit 3
VKEAIALKQAEAKTLFGFWTYLMTDCILFATLFATFAVLRNNTFGGPGGQELFNLPFVLAETLILFGITFLLGASFLTLELNEFHKLVVEGNSWRRSGFLSAFFTLVGTHGAHISAGLIWMLTMMFRVYQNGLNATNVKRLKMLSMFWHFLDIVWIFIFSIVYLMGVI